MSLGLNKCLLPYFHDFQILPNVFRPKTHKIAYLDMFARLTLVSFVKMSLYRNAIADLHIFNSPSLMANIGNDVMLQICTKRCGHKFSLLNLSRRHTLVKDACGDHGILRNRTSGAD